MTDFCMPSLGSDMEAGTLVEWNIQPGDEVHRGDIVAVVETVKGAIDVEIFEDGIIETLLVAPGTEIPVGTPLARLRACGEKTEPPSEKPAPEKLKQEEPVPTPGIAPSPGRQRISPFARRRAKELGMDLSTVIGSDPNRAITVFDIEATAKRLKAGLKTDMNAMRAAIAAAMSHSKREIPHYYLSAKVDMEPCMHWLETQNNQREPSERLLPVILIAKAMASVMARFPEFNGYYTSDGFAPSKNIHIGMAISLRGGGLIAPALHDCRNKDLDQLMSEFRDLVERARGGHLRSSEMSDPTITLSSLGERGVEEIMPIIFPPQVAIIGCGTVTEQPWAEGGKLSVRRGATISLAADHRVSDGHRGALFLSALAHQLQNPEKL